MNPEMKLSVKTSLPEPFDFHLTVGHQTHFRGRAGADLYADGTYYRALRCGNKIIVAAASPVDDDNLEVRVLSAGGERELEFANNAMRHLLALDIDLSGFYSMLEHDQGLSAAVGRLYGLRPPRSESVFEALVVAIIGQQISANVAGVIREGLVAAYGTRVQAEGNALYAFPSPESLNNATPDDLRALKLSTRKVEYLQGVARRTLEGELEIERFTGMDNEEVIVELTKVRGIGRWSAEWMLMRALGRLDVLPAGDLALRRVVQELYFDGAAITELQLAAFAKERWAPYRGLATTYLFAYLRLQRLPKSGTALAPQDSAARGRERA
jgi:DNA-3-methyladenine glycosylase II